VFNGKLYTGQLGECAQLWGDEQVNPAQTYDYWNGLEWVPAPPTAEFSARVNMTQPWMPVGVYGPMAWGRPIAKCSIPVGGWIYIGGGGTGMFRTQSWWTGTSQAEIVPIATPGGELPESMCTDGEYIFSTTYSWIGQSNANRIYKYVPDHVAGTLTNASGWPVTVAGASGFSGISYYGGKIYAVDSGSPYGIYEIDAATGVATKLADFIYPNALGDDTQVVRYGNQLFIVCAATSCHKLYTYTLSGAVWTAISSLVVQDNTLYPLDVYGVAVKGDGTTAKYAWVTAEGATMQFFGLSDPWAGSPTDLKAATWKTGYRAYVDNAVVTAIGPDGGFWIENRDRTTAAHVIWGDTPPAIGNLVTIKGTGGKTASGERELTAVPGTGMVEGSWADPEVKPFIMTNRSLGSATGSKGLANDGMLVKVYGKVTYYDPSSGAFYIDDGSGVPSDIPLIKGVKVLKADGSTMAEVPNWALVTAGSTCYARVTGVVRLEKLPDGTIIRRIDARSDGEIVITAP